jgi:hypothetical protein
MEVRLHQFLDEVHFFEALEGSGLDDIDDGDDVLALLTSTQFHPHRGIERDVRLVARQSIARASAHVESSVQTLHGLSAPASAVVKENWTHSNGRTGQSS